MYVMYLVPRYLILQSCLNELWKKGVIVSEVDISTIPHFLLDSHDVNTMECDDTASSNNSVEITSGDLCSYI
jgi:hypothetical protein